MLTFNCRKYFFIFTKKSLFQTCWILTLSCHSRQYKFLATVVPTIVGATAYAARATTAAVHKVFGELVILQDLWLPR